MDIIKEIKNIIKKSRSTKSAGIIDILLGILFVLFAISLSNANKWFWMLSGVVFSRGITRLINAYYFKNFLKKLENENDQKNVAEKVAD